jgi:hypothetical protein
VKLDRQQSPLLMPSQKKDQNVSLQSAHEEGSLGSRAVSAAL